MIWIFFLIAYHAVISIILMLYQSAFRAEQMAGDIARYRLHQAQKENARMIQDIHNMSVDLEEVERTMDQLEIEDLIDELNDEASGGSNK